MKNLFFLFAFLSIATLSNAQTKLYGGLAFANNGPKAELGFVENYAKHGFKIKTSLSYTFENSYKSTSSYNESDKSSDIHHLSVSSVVLFNLTKFDLGGGVSYRFFLPYASANVGLELVAQTHITEKIDLQVVYDRTINGYNYASIGVNYYLF